MSLNNKIVLLLLGVVMGSVVSVGGFLVFDYLNSVNAENLTIADFTVQDVTGFYSAIEFNLKNVGNTNVEIISVRMNGYLNRSIENWNKGWEGNLMLKPGQSGKVYVYEFSYFYVLNSSMPHISASPSQTELDNLVAWANSYGCTFSFMSKTQQQYNQTVPRLASTMVQAWLGLLTNQTQQAGTLITTENVRWYGTPTTSAHNRTDINVRNIGTSTVKIVRVYLGTSPSNLALITGYCTAGINATVNPQNIATITIQWPIAGIGNTYTVGTTYYFSIATEPGTSYVFQNAPTGV